MKKAKKQKAKSKAKKPIKKKKNFKINRLPDGHCFAVVDSDDVVDFMKQTFGL
jgi:hypothetical protein